MQFLTSLGNGLVVQGRELVVQVLEFLDGPPTGKLHCVILESTEYALTAEGGGARVRRESGQVRILDDAPATATACPPRLLG